MPEPELEEPEPADCVLVGKPVPVGSGTPVSLKVAEGSFVALDGGPEIGANDVSTFNVNGGAQILIGRVAHLSHQQRSIAARNQLTEGLI